MGVARKTRELRRQLRARRRPAFVAVPLNVTPSDQQFWWFFDRLTPQERSRVNYALNGQDVNYQFGVLVRTNPELAQQSLTVPRFRSANER